MPKLYTALWDQLIAEFPPLWNPRDLCFRDLHVRKQCRQQLLEKANRVSSVPITMESLRKRLRNVNKRLRQGSCQESLDSKPSLLITTNPDSMQPQTQTITHMNRISLRELAAEYPCLWDSVDVNYTNALMKTNCEEQLLVKYNNLSSTPISMAQLREELHDLRTQPDGGRPTENQEPEDSRAPSPQSSRRLEDLIQECPSVWDREARGYYHRRVKKLTYRKLLHKYNGMTTESNRINYSQLRNMIESVKRKQEQAVAAAAGRRTEDTRADWQSELGNSSDSTDQANPNNQAPVLSIVYLRCAVCGEVKSERLNHNDKSYINNNKTTLTFNNLSVELNYCRDAFVCKICDKKLKEMHEFVKLVKNAQDKIYGANVTDVITLDDDDNDDQKLIIDSVTVTDTEVTPRVSHKRKSEETPVLKKKCRVTIDLNSCDSDRSMDDIAKYGMFKNDSIIVDANDPEKVLKVIGTGYGEDITLNVKEEIDTDDIHEEVDETGDVSTDDDKSNIVIADIRTCNSEDVMKQKEAEDVLKNVETSNTVTHEEKQNNIDGNGEVVNKEDKRNGIINEHTNDSEIIGAAASTVQALASKEPVCVMPKSELIGLVESIVNRMLNK